MNKQNKRNYLGLILMSAMLLSGITVGWFLRKNNRETELMDAVDKITKQNGTLFVQEFDGVVGLAFPRISDGTDNSSELMDQLERAMESDENQKRK